MLFGATIGYESSFDECLFFGCEKCIGSRVGEVDDDEP